MRALAPSRFAHAAAILLTVAAAAAACSGPERRDTERARPLDLDAGVTLEAPPPLEPQGPIVPEDDRAPDGDACTTTAECETGEQCRGAPGCASGWACGEARECMDESVAYCDCDGVTFYAAGGCAGRAYAHVGPCEPVGEAIAAGAELGIHDWDEPPTEDARACGSSADCSRGAVCWGVAGCATTWSCVRARGCRRDSVPYCGCDGETFSASSTCPGRPFVHRGACREALALAEDRTRDGSGQRERDGSAIGREGAAPTPRSTGASGATAAVPRGRDGAGVERADGPDAGASTGMLSVEAPAGPVGCRSNRDCSRGQVCQGPAGCGADTEWTCGPPERECVRDTQVFCDCEGNDFRASMFCPARPYRHRGSCEIDRMLDLSGAAVR